MYYSTEIYEVHKSENLFHIQMYGGFIPCSPDVELHPKAVNAIALVEGVADTSPAPSGCFFSKSFDRCSKGIGYVRVLGKDWE